MNTLNQSDKSNTKRFSRRGTFLFDINLIMEEFTFNKQKAYATFASYGGKMSSIETYIRHECTNYDYLISEENYLSYKKEPWFKDISKDSFTMSVRNAVNGSIYDYLGKYNNTVQNNLDDKNAELNKLVNSLQGQAAISETRIKNNENAIKNLKKESAKLASEVESLKNKNTTLESKNTTLESDVESLKEQFNTSNEQYKSASKDYECAWELAQEHENTIAQLKDRIAQLEVENAQLKDRIAQLEVENAQLRVENVELRAQMAEMNAKLDTQKAEMEAKMEAQQAKMEAKMEAQKVEMEAQQAKMEARINEMYVSEADFEDAPITNVREANVMLEKVQKAFANIIMPSSNIVLAHNPESNSYKLHKARLIKWLKLVSNRTNACKGFMDISLQLNMLNLIAAKHNISCNYQTTATGKAASAVNFTKRGFGIA